MMTFNAIDVETANNDSATICQIGIAQVEEGCIIAEWETLVNPEVEFNYFNVGIHGITADHVQHSPTMPEIWDDLRNRLQGSVVVSHSFFDRRAFQRAMNKYGLEPLQVAKWLNSVTIAKRAWPKLGGWSLDKVSQFLGIKFNHHDALEDAKAAAQIVIRANNRTG